MIAYPARESQYLELLKKVLTGFIYPESSDRVLEAEHSFRPVGLVRSALVKLAAKRGIRLVKHRPFCPELREEGRDWPSIAYTMVGLKRLNNVQHAIETVIREQIPGDICECGVWRGGVAIFMRAVLKELGDETRTVWLADSFSGLPKPNAARYPADTGYDLSGMDYLSVPLEKVQNNFKVFQLLDDRVQFLKGWFSETLPIAPIKKLSVLRADGDLYESTMDILNTLYAKVSPRGFVIIDDYYSWEPCRKAVDNFRSIHNITEPIVAIDKSGAFWRP